MQNIIVVYTNAKKVQGKLDINLLSNSLSPNPTK